MAQKIYIVDWIDTAAESGWKEANEIQSFVVTCQTVGFLVNETKAILTLALNRGLRNAKHPYGELVHIPKVAIIKKRKLKLKK